MTTYENAKARKHEGRPQVPTIGRIVHYVLSPIDTELMKGKSRPGIVVSLGVDGGHTEPVNLQVFTNGGHDALPAVHWKKDVPHDEENRAHGTWHWPPHANDPPFRTPAQKLEDLEKQLEASRSQAEAEKIEVEIERSKVEADEKHFVDYGEMKPPTPAKEPFEKAPTEPPADDIPFPSNFKEPFG